MIVNIDSDNQVFYMIHIKFDFIKKPEDLQMHHNVKTLFVKFLVVSMHVLK